MHICIYSVYVGAYVYIYIHISLYLSIYIYILKEMSISESITLISRASPEGTGTEQGNESVRFPALGRAAPRLQPHHQCGDR